MVQMRAKKTAGVNRTRLTMYDQYKSETEYLYDKENGSIKVYDDEDCDEDFE